MRNDFSSNYLAHHGILGMKWGQRNGPPYPLDASDHSSSEKKAGYKKSIGGGRNEELYSKRQLRNRKKKNFDKDTEEYNHAKLRQGKNIINKRAGDEYNKSKADERTIKKYLKKYGGEKYNEDKIADDYRRWLDELVKKYDQSHKSSEEANLPNKPTNFVGTYDQAKEVADDLHKKGIYTMEYTEVETGKRHVDPIKDQRIAMAILKDEAYEEQTKAMKAAKKNSSKSVDGADVDRMAREAAKKAGLDQGDNWKMYRDAQAGDKRAQEVVNKWESDKKYSKNKKKK